jgi:hypothetical protein
MRRGIGAAEEVVLCLFEDSTFLLQLLELA